MKRQSRKLTLNRETLRHLSETALPQAGGAGDWSFLFTCRGVCTRETIFDTLESECYCPSNTDCSGCPTCPF